MGFEQSVGVCFVIVDSSIGVQLTRTSAAFSFGETGHIISKSFSFNK